MPKDGKKAEQKLKCIFKEIGSMKDLPPENGNVRLKVTELKQCITDNFYTCTDIMLKQLAQMYVLDERFKKNIASYGGEGTAEFVKRAVDAYCN